MIISLTQLVDLDGLLQAFGIKVLRRGASADCRCGAAKLEKVISPRTHELWQSSRLMDDNFLDYQPWNLNPSLRGHRWVKTMTPPRQLFGIAPARCDLRISPHHPTQLTQEIRKIDLSVCGDLMSSFDKLYCMSLCCAEQIRR
jgi:hypothetical protein